MNKILKELENKSILIGSRRWGGYKDSSDYDYAISEVYSNIFIEEFFKNDIKIKKNTSGYFEEDMYTIENYYVSLDGKKINILVYSKERFELIYKLNEMMDSLKKVDFEIFNDKKMRIYFCEGILKYLIGNLDVKDDLDFLDRLDFF